MECLLQRTWHGVAEIEDEDEAIERHETDDGGPSVADIASQWTGNEDSDERSQLARDLERGLPFRFDQEVARILVVIVWVESAEVLNECWERYEVTDEEDVWITLAIGHFD